MRATEEQRAILEALSGPVRIAAGAGTGKTDTLRRAIVHLIDERAVSPGEILCLTFTVEASEEMRRRIFRELKEREELDPDELTVQTYHAFAATIIREYALLLGLQGDPVLLDRARAWQLALENLDRVSYAELEIGWLPFYIDNFLTLSDELSRHVVSVEDAQSWREGRPGAPVAAKRAEALAAVDSYRELKRARNAIDFGDQIALAVELLRSQPEVAVRVRGRFRYLVLDEYQDTDVAQRELVKLVGEGAELVLAVGDVDQGIFGWRGASLHNMFAYPDDFPGTTSLPLSVNFRSGEKILDLANLVITKFQGPQGYERKELTPWEEAPDATIEAFVAPHEFEEADGIAQRVEAVGEPWDEVAVLCRRRAQFEAIYRALTARGIPVDVDELGGFWTRPEILDVIAWLRVLADPADNLALARLLLGPCYRLSQRDLYFLAAHAKDENRRLRKGDHDYLPFSLADAIVAADRIDKLSEEARARIAELRATWQRLADAAARSTLPDLVGEVARLSRLAGELAASPDPEAEVALRHLAKLRDLAQEYAPVAGSPDLAGFVAYLDSVEDSDQDDDELRIPAENAVRLLTLHRAKGLEWTTVFIPGIANDLLPLKSRGGNNPATCWWRLPFELRGDRAFLPRETDEGIGKLRRDEERRLFYVGITRAKERLVLSRAWFYGDNKRAKAPSPYWHEVTESGLVAITADCENPQENPHPLGLDVELASKPRIEIERAEPAALERLEQEYERLRELERGRPTAARWQPPSTVSVTALLTFLRDEEEFFWRYVRRVPSPPSPAARLGTDLHRRIEQRARGTEPLGSVPPAEETELYDLDASERRGDAKAVKPEELWANFERSRFAQETPLATEQPFVLYLGEGLSVEGRIDAIFEREDGSWEVVDYKTGDPAHADPLQLAIYGRAVEKIWSREVTRTWFFLRDGREESREPVEGLDAELEAAVRRLRTFS